jgi:Helix-turn-helix domain
MPDYISLKEAAKRSGLHENSLRRLLRAGDIQGYKRGWWWMVSTHSLDAYTDPIMGFLLELPGPKLYLTKREDNDED